MVASVGNKNLGTQSLWPVAPAGSQVVSDGPFAEDRTLEAMRTQPQAIFFDAAGTLFEVRGSVGEIYSRIASQYGCEADAEHLQQNFARWFRLQPPMAFPPGTDETRLREMEKSWWRNLVRAVFADCGPFPHFEQFFDDVFEQFRNAELWRVFDDVIPALTELRNSGILLGVISNFDSRFYDVLEAVGLAPFFDSVHISTRVGAAKPDPAIFQAALAAHRIEPHEAWHVGDSLREDIEGAKAAGLKAILIDRKSLETNSLIHISSLTELLTR